MINSFIFRANYIYEIAKRRSEVITLTTPCIRIFVKSLQARFNYSAISSVSIKTVLMLRGTNKVAIGKHGELYHSSRQSKECGVMRIVELEDVRKAYSNTFLIFSMNFYIFGDILEVCDYTTSSEHRVVVAKKEIRVANVNCPVLPNTNISFTRLSKLMEDVAEDKYLQPLKPLKQGYTYESTQL